MTRYNTEEDDKKNLQLLGLLAAQWRYRPLEFKENSRADYALVDRDNVVQLFIECKIRTNPIGQYQSVMIPEEKVIKLRRAAEIFCTPARFVCQWTDRTGWVDLSKATGEVRVSGRKDRNDPNDIKPHLFIPNEQFEEILWGE